MPERMEYKPSTLQPSDGSVVNSPEEIEHRLTEWASQAVIGEQTSEELHESVRKAHADLIGQIMRDHMGYDEASIRRAQESVRVSADGGEKLDVTFDVPPDVASYLDSLRCG